MNKLDKALWDNILNKEPAEMDKSIRAILERVIEDLDAKDKIEVMFSLRAVATDILIDIKEKVMPFDGKEMIHAEK